MGRSSIPVFFRSQPKTYHVSFTTVAKREAERVGKGRGGRKCERWMFNERGRWEEEVARERVRAERGRNAPVESARRVAERERERKKEDGSGGGGGGGANIQLCSELTPPHRGASWADCM